MRFGCVAPGIYQEKKTGALYERPYVGGLRTWRRLKSRTLKLAKAELAAKRTDQARAVHGFAKDPYAPPAKSIGELCARFIKERCPDRNHRPRSGLALESETYRIGKLLPFWSRKLATNIKTKDCAEYYSWRKKRVKRGDGGRAIDLELTTLSNVLNWAVSVGEVESNPLASGRPRFRNTKAIKHCRDYMPTDGNELHALARALFSDPRSETLGWQLLLEAMTGCRTCEALKLRWDAKHRGQPGFIEGDWLWLSRAKGGVKPFAFIHPALRKCLSALRQWQISRHPRSKWFLPSHRLENAPVERGSLTHALRRISPEICGAHRTSHGLRAFYVTVRRSQGFSDAQAADEIGNKSGAAIIVSTYGAVPPNWRGSDGLSWLPTNGEPAWEVLNLPKNVVSLDYRRVYRHKAKA